VRNSIMDLATVYAQTIGLAEPGVIYFRFFLWTSSQQPDMDRSAMADMIYVPG